MRWKALFYILAISLMSGFIRQLYPHIWFCIQSVAILFHLKYKKNPASDRNIVGTGRRITAFPDNCGHSSLILYQNVTSCRFLKFSCNVESQKRINELFMLFIVKSFGLSWTYNGSLIHACLCNKHALVILKILTQWVMQTSHIWCISLYNIKIH